MYSITAIILHINSSMHQPKINSWLRSSGTHFILYFLFNVPSDVIPTLCFKTFTEFRLGLSIGPQATFGVELVGHGGCSDHSFQAALALGYVLLWMEENHVDLRHVEHSQRD